MAEINAPTVITPSPAPVANGTVGEWTFLIHCKTVWVNNSSGQNLYIKINGAAGQTVSAADYHVLIPNGSCREVTEGGRVNIKKISGFAPTGATVSGLIVCGYTLGQT